MDVGKTPTERDFQLRQGVAFYFGDCKPGDVSHSFMREAVSVCRALRINSSRSIPGGRALARSLRR